MNLPYLHPDDRPWFSPEFADADGLVGVGGTLSPEVLLCGYADGVFPWYNEGDPILWWSPDPRAIFTFEGLHVSRRLARTLRSGKFRVTYNHCFERVMRACGENRPEGTWVSEPMIEAYTSLHKLGYAHSVETWVDDNLAGGVYGVAIGGLFAAESMFYRITDGSKAALVALRDQLQRQGFTLWDVQMPTDHTETLGVVEIARSDYLFRLRQAVNLTDVRFLPGQDPLPFPPKPRRHRR
ncbi:MAG: leucyl/phenylalanyl-tRNA--protein transferase [Gemmataceae bacterium]